ncbi:MAG: hypothetical protein ABFS56_18570 [Pseudomonadota bacterium]
MKKQKRLIVTLVSGFILGGVSSLGLAYDCGDPGCAHSYKSYQGGQYSDRGGDCAQRSSESWEQRNRGYDYGESGCAQRESWQERERREREAVRVQRQVEREINVLVENELDALEHRQDKCRQVEAAREARPVCGDRYLEGNRQNRGCQEEVVCPNR